MMMRSSRGKLYRPLQPCVVRTVSLVIVFSLLKTATTCKLMHVIVSVYILLKVFTVDARSH